MGAIISLVSRSRDVDAGEVQARSSAISEHPLDDLLLNGTAEAEPRWHVTITIISHEEQQPAGFGGVPASATAIAELERQEYGAMAEPRKKKRRRDSTGEASLSPTTTAVSCPICLEDFVVGDGLIVMPCSHRFHGSCLTEWLKLSHFCPCCRHALIPTLVTPAAKDPIARRRRLKHYPGEATELAKRMSVCLVLNGPVSSRSDRTRMDGLSRARTDPVISDLIATLCVALAALHADSRANGEERATQLSNGFTATHAADAAAPFEPVLYAPNRAFALGFLRVGAASLDLAVVHLPSSFPLWRATPARMGDWSRAATLAFDRSLVLLTDPEQAACCGAR
ncbi:hypothetical protein EJB05_29503, partial [Eragrostis curvula]